MRLLARPPGFKLLLHEFKSECLHVLQFPRVQEYDDNDGADTQSAGLSGSPSLAFVFAFTNRRNDGKVLIGRHAMNSTHQIDKRRKGRLTEGTVSLSHLHGLCLGLPQAGTCQGCTGLRPHSHALTASAGVYKFPQWCLWGSTAGCQSQEARGC